MSDRDRDDRDRRNREADAGEGGAEREIEARLQAIRAGRVQGRETFRQQHERGDDDADEAFRRAEAVDDAVR